MTATTVAPIPIPALLASERPLATGSCAAFVGIAGIVAVEAAPSTVDVGLLVAIQSTQLLFLCSYRRVKGSLGLGGSLGFVVGDVVSTTLGVDCSEAIDSDQFGSLLMLLLR